MLNLKLVTRSGGEIYPSYISREEKESLRKEYGDEREYMWCGCREDKKLYYRISSDLKLYPEHNGYEHDRFCIFRTEENGRKKSGYLTDNRSGEIEAYLNFKPESFTLSVSKKDREESRSEEKAGEDAEKEEEEKKESEDSSEPEKKDPFLSLAEFVRHVNLDTFNERMAERKPILSKGYFTSALFGRLKRVHVAGMEKNLRDYTLDTDGFQFFYARYLGKKEKIRGERTSYLICLESKQWVEFQFFIYESILKKAEKEFEKTYGYPPEGENIMAAGFRYLKAVKIGNGTYKVVGRLHLFVVSDNGLYARNLREKINFDLLMKYLKEKSNGRIRFFIPLEEENIDGVFELDGHTRKGLWVRNVEEEYGNHVCQQFDICKDTVDTDKLNEMLYQVVTGKT